MKSGLVAALCCTTLGAWARPPQADVHELLRKSIANSERNWKEAPNFVYLEHDVEEKLDSRGRVKTKTDKTYEVSIIDGSQYNRLLKVNGKPLSPEQQSIEDAKMKAEADKRRSQSRTERANRIGKYEKERKQDQAMLREMADAFDYTFVGEETIAGRATYVLNASPKAGYVPKTRDTKVLTAMKGKLWIDKADLQWVKVEAEVTRPVSFYAVATVSPGTKFILEQEPVGEGIWMPKHFAVRVNSNVLWMARNSSGDERYSDYRRVGGEAARIKNRSDAHN